MNKLALLSPVLTASLLMASLASSAWGATYYVGPEGAGEVCTRAEPCALGTGAERAQAGDTVILLDGTYQEPLHPENSGTPDAWITFQADQCALPIIEGLGEAIMEVDGVVPSGVASNTGSYLRFIGIVSRYWDSGFTNGWTGEGTTNSNGHIEYINCIGEGNGRTGFAMYSAGGLTVRECLSAHNGGSPTDSWSSGIQLYAVQGTPEENVVERSISFENTDAQKRSDGSGFIVDEHTQGASFINNIAFRNGGSCMRLTRSNNTRLIHFSCYHNGMNPEATGPTNPGEFYFTDQQSRDTAIVINTLAAASGTDADPAVFIFPPETGLSANLTVDSGAAPFFSAPEADHPDFRPPASAAAQLENQGTTNGAPSIDAPSIDAPSLDIGFDPKCIIRRDPGVPYQHSWWTHSIDYDYIRSIGGVGQCFHPKPRTGGPDIGAYELSGPPHTFSQPGSCIPDLTEPDAGGAAPDTPVSGVGGANAGDGSDGTEPAPGPNTAGNAGADLPNAVPTTPTDITNPSPVAPPGSVVDAPSPSNSDLPLTGTAPEPTATLGESAANDGREASCALRRPSPPASLERLSTALFGLVLWLRRGRRRSQNRKTAVSRSPTR